MAYGLWGIRDTAWVMTWWVIWSLKSLGLAQRVTMPPVPVIQSIQDDQKK